VGKKREERIEKKHELPQHHERSEILPKSNTHKKERKTGIRDPKPAGGKGGEKKKANPPRKHCDEAPYFGELRNTRRVIAGRTGGGYDSSTSEGGRLVHQKLPHI